MAELVVNNAVTPYFSTPTTKLYMNFMFPKDGTGIVTNISLYHDLKMA